MDDFFSKATKSSWASNYACCVDKSDTTDSVLLNDKKDGKINLKGKQPANFQSSLFTKYMALCFAKFVILTD